MTRRLLILTGLLSLVAPVATASIQLIELDLAAPVNPWDFQTAAFGGLVPVFAIQEISLQLEGTVVDQLFMCGLPYNLTYESARIEVRLGDDVVDAPFASVLHTFPPATDPTPYLIEIPLLDGSWTDWGFLFDLAGEVGLAINALNGGYIGEYPCNPMDIPITVSEATLRVTFDQSIPATRTTWDAVKGLYR